MPIIRQLQTSADFAEYDAWIRSHPYGSLWQSLEWKKFQEQRGQRTRIYVDRDGSDGPIRCSALVVMDSTTLNLTTWDIGRGPLWDATCTHKDIAEFVREIRHEAKRARALSLTFSTPSVLTSTGEYGGEELSSRHVYPEATILLDLTMSNDELLAQMHPKGRYNIKVAEKNGVATEQAIDVPAFYQLVQETAARDKFRHPSKATYQQFLHELPGSFLLLAYEAEHSPIAGLMGTIWNRTGIYYYGASSHAHRSLMAPYLLQWAAIQYCKNQGCTRYDFFGIAPPGSEHHPWAGVTDFKRKFGGETLVYPPEQKMTLRPMTEMLLRVKRRMMG